MARMHEACKYYKLARKWLDRLDLHDKFYSKPVEHAEDKAAAGHSLRSACIGSTEAARCAGR